MIWLVAAVVVFQLVSGCTLGADQFRARSDIPMPIGRWKRLVKRSEEPEYYWTVVICQAVFFSIYIVARELRRTRNPEFDVGQIVDEFKAKQKQEEMEKEAERRKWSR